MLKPRHMVALKEKAYWKELLTASWNWLRVKDDPKKQGVADTGSATTFRTEIDNPEKTRLPIIGRSVARVN